MRTGITFDTLELVESSSLRNSMRGDVLEGIVGSFKQLPAKYLYDERGSQLFEEITELHEYYPTRTEAAILSAFAAEIATASGAEALLELGSGSSAKTHLLLDALREAGTLRSYIPVDVSPSALSAAVASLERRHEALDLYPAVADFGQHLHQLPYPGRRLIAFLGSTIGNYEPSERKEFLNQLTLAMQPGETLLLGVDLIKSPARLLAAYDDPAGVSAAFALNVLAVLNRELGADFNIDDFDYVAQWDDIESRIDMRLRARREHAVHIADLDLTLSFLEGEELRTEISTKFTREGIEAELGDAGLVPCGWWTDVAEDFGVVLARR
jgi:L-histidine Nalpha-methyltransferase